MLNWPWAMDDGNLHKNLEINKNYIYKNIILLFYYFIVLLKSTFKIEILIL